MENKNDVIWDIGPYRVMYQDMIGLRIQELINYPFLKNLNDVNNLCKKLEEYKEEFAFVFSFHPLLIDKVTQIGAFPMAIDVSIPVFAPKLHHKRCILKFDDMIIHKSWRRRAKKYSMSINTCFDKVVDMCHEFHGENWLFPKLVAAFKHIYENPQMYRINIFSIEVWRHDNDDDRLVASELGFTVGTLYTSLTGAKRESGAGSVQLAALGRILQKCGYELWDFGMSMEYKLKFGAKNIDRKDWMNIVKENRDDKPISLLRWANNKYNCRDLIDQKININ